LKNIFKKYRQRAADLANIGEGYKGKRDWSPGMWRRYEGL
jgi:hypothetical protein